MSFLDWLWPEKKSATTSSDILRALMAESESKAGQVVNLRTALEVSTVFACARVIAEGIAQVPWRLYRRADDGGREQARDHPLFRLLHRRPNDWQTSFEFREQIALHLVLTGNAFVFVNRVRGEVRELLPFEPGQVTVRRNADMTLEYTVNAGQRYTIPQADMWHIRGPSWNGYVGMNAVHQARNAIGMSLATEEFGSALFANGARPGGVLSAPGSLTPDQAQQIRESWARAHEGGGNAMKTAVLSGGLSYHQLAQTADEAQFNETRKQVAQDICGFFRVNPIMIQRADGSASYASVEQMFLAHLVHTLMPWYERIDQSADVNLLTSEEQRQGYYVKLESKGLMRGTAKERAEFMQIMVQNGAATVNEWREAEDMDRSDDLDADKLRPAVNIYGPGPAPSEE